MEFGECTVQYVPIVAIAYLLPHAHTKGACLAFQKPEFDLQYHIHWVYGCHWVTHSHNLSIQELETGWSEVQGHSQLLNEFGAKMDLRLYLLKKVSFTVWGVKCCPRDPGLKLLSLG